MGDCIFCKIINGDIPSAKVYEDEYVYAFLDISQVTKGHTLVIPKVHKENIFELPSDLASHLFKAVPEIANAIKKAFNPAGLNILNNNGAVAGQTVFHYHVHLLPRYGEEDAFHPAFETTESPYSQEEFQQIAESIKNQL
ncbi:histidine triad (HIT) family protein [Bacillus ectoiniformans]|uniref:HIT family protein n=1 Tax=Bacillus ectoiniformans TaxID=1494429 RepID=UPI0019586D53|nr:HIT family protein [Bacillus ectoiniformans]MBM7647609.1 histidine triad (HIT) family protein [Bacillus ectoiniformans]